MDKRTERSRRLIQDAFQSLLQERDYGSITVQDVLDRAGVGRSTFYAHFSGKADLLARLVDGICEHAMAPVRAERNHDFTGRACPVASCEHVLCHMREREGGLRALLDGEGLRLLAACLRDEVAQRADELLPERPEGAAAQMDRDFLVNHVAGSFVEMVLWWARRGLRDDPHRLAVDYVAAIGAVMGHWPVPPELRDPMRARGAACASDATGRGGADGHGHAGGARGERGRSHGGTEARA